MCSKHVLGFVYVVRHVGLAYEEMRNMEDPVKKTDEVDEKIEMETLYQSLVNIDDFEVKPRL